MKSEVDLACCSCCSCCSCCCFLIYIAGEALERASAIGDSTSRTGRTRTWLPFRGRSTIWRCRTTYFCFTHALLGSSCSNCECSAVFCDIAAHHIVFTWKAVTRAAYSTCHMFVQYRRPVYLCTWQKGGRCSMHDAVVGWRSAAVHGHHIHGCQSTLPYHAGRAERVICCSWSSGSNSDCATGTAQYLHDNFLSMREGLFLQSSPGLLGSASEKRIQQCRVDVTSPD